MMLTPSSRLGSYEIIAPLGAGGMGEVYRARDMRLGRDVAIKVLPAEVASSREWLDRFEREAKTVAALNHPNIVVLHSIEEADGVRFLTMELVEGRTLATLITPGGLPLARVLDLAIPLAEALAAAHEKHVVHRDLKPSNVMVTRDGRVKVLDFGLARVTHKSPDSDLTQTAITPISTSGQVVGTVGYMSPEQILGEAVDGRSDLFALAIILYELATGKRPFTGTSHIEVSYAILHETPESLTSVRADLGGDLERIVDLCLEKNPRERIQTALGVSNELRRARKALERGTTRAPAKVAAGRQASIAVLPFVNRSASADDEYFSDGLADELLNVLARIKGLRVSARASSFHFKGKNVPLSEIGRTLNVAAVLDGSVRKAGNRVRISVQLVKVDDGYHLWSETYDRTLDDIFAVQDDIAQSVVKELRVTLLGEEADSNASGEAMADVARAAKGRATHAEAHRLSLQARYVGERFTREDMNQAVAYLKQALELDPEFALAWADLGDVYGRAAAYGLMPVEEAYALARAAIERALSLEPDLTEAYVALAWVQWAYEWNMRAAESSLRRALELAPGNPIVLRRVGRLAQSRGRFEEAISLYRRAMEQDPLSARAYQSLGSMLHEDGRHAEGEEMLRKALELAPQMIITHSRLAMALLAQHRGEEALAEAAREPDEVYRLCNLAIIHWVQQRPEESDASLRTLIEKYSESAAFQVAAVYARRGDADGAFGWLERAYAQRDGGLVDTESISDLRSLHQDPRWRPFLKKIGFGD